MTAKKLTCQIWAQQYLSNRWYWRVVPLLSKRGQLRKQENPHKWRQWVCNQGVYPGFTKQHFDIQWSNLLLKVQGATLEIKTWFYDKFMLWKYGRHIIPSVNSYITEATQIFSKCKGGMYDIHAQNFLWHLNFSSSGLFLGELCQETIPYCIWDRQNSELPLHYW